ncbi:MAG: response regulator [Paracoccaceae bacterium]
MPDIISDFFALRAPTPERPLLGLTVLVVEDSRFTCEALRLMCARSGARLRRADCLRSARRHLQAYRPGVVVVDLGLPDGSGLDLIVEIAGQRGPAPALLATSGDASAGRGALAAGADAFLPKPVESLQAFQRAVLGALSPIPRPVDRPDKDDRINPDRLALRDDLAHAADMLQQGVEADYLAQFLRGVALSAHDDPLRAAAEALARDQDAGRALAAPLGRVSALVAERLSTGASI